MSDNISETNDSPNEFDFSTFPIDTLFHERRTGTDRRALRAISGIADGRSEADSHEPNPPERRARKERRKRIDPTTFEKQYTDDELEFMNAMQRFKEHTGKAFPTHGEVLKVAAGLGYRKPVQEPSGELHLVDPGAAGSD
jgi:hypothetical protein